MSGMEYVRTNSLQLAQQCLVWKPDGVREEFVMCPWLTQRRLRARLSGFFAPTFGSEAIAFSICVKRSRKEDRFSTLEALCWGLRKDVDANWPTRVQWVAWIYLGCIYTVYIYNVQVYIRRNICLVLGLGCPEASKVLHLNSFPCLFFNVPFMVRDLTFQSVPAPGFRMDPLVNLWETMSASIMPHNAPSVWRTTVALKIEPRLGVVAYHKRNYEEVWSLPLSLSL